MNLCRDCNSEYATPGTCNCYAPGGKRELLTISLGETTVTVQPQASVSDLLDAIDAEVRRRALAVGGAMHPAAQGIVNGLRVGGLS